MTPEELAYIERVIRRQTIISDLVDIGVHSDFLTEILDDDRCTTEALEQLLAGLIRLNLKYHGVDK